MQAFLSDIPYELELFDRDRWLFVGGFVVLGAVLGSFLNVVIYRLPLGMSLSTPGSRCPNCGHPIRWYDNVPVLGWFWLRGRCRDCGAPFSARYPLIEGLVAIIAGLLACQAPTQWATIALDDATHSLYSVDVAWVVFRLLLSCVLVSAAFIEFDRFVPPWRMILVPLALGLAMLGVWPHLLVEQQLEGLPAAMKGMLCAAVLGAGPWLAWRLSARADRVRYASAAIGELMLVGAFLGADNIISIALAVTALYVATQLAARKWPAAGRFGWAGPLALVTLVWMIAGADAERFNLTWVEDDRLRLLIGAALMTLMAIVLQLVTGRPRSAQT